VSAGNGSETASDIQYNLDLNHDLILKNDKEEIALLASSGSAHVFSDNAITVWHAFNNGPHNSADASHIFQCPRKGSTPSYPIRRASILSYETIFSSFEASSPSYPTRIRSEVFKGVHEAESTSQGGRLTFHLRRQSVRAATELAINGLIKTGPKSHWGVLYSDNAQCAFPEKSINKNKSRLEPFGACVCAETEQFFLGQAIVDFHDESSCLSQVDDSVQKELTSH
jgi:hypothetical protein